MRRARRTSLRAAAAALCAARGARAQPAAAPAESAPGHGVRVSAQAVAQGARAADAYDGRARTEGALTQPVVMAHGPLAGGRVRSPEDVTGAGLDQHKANVAARWAGGAPVGAAGLGGAGDGQYALAEWARTDELRGARRAFRYESVLVEGAARRRGVELALRWERTTRPEEERLVDPFRTVRPHNEFNLLGLTEWRTATASVGVPVRAGALRLLPFAEVARGVPREVLRPSAFEPRAFYGARALWTGVLGVRFGVGAPHARMGRYGVAAEH